MLYLWPCSGSMRAFSDQYGVMTSPAKWQVEIPIIEGRLWAMDNGAFKNGFQPDRYFAHLAALQPYRATCLFVVAPDQLCDAKKTLHLWHRWAPQITGWSLAFVAQNGQETLSFPTGCDWVFIGGDNAFKLGPAGRTCIERALVEGKRVHVGRVNSQKRYRYFDGMGAHSCDGTGPTREPDGYKNRLDTVMAQPSLFRAALPGRDSSG